MDPPPPPKAKPALKLKFGSQNGVTSGNPLSQPTTPSSQTPVRTPSLKLSFGKKPAGVASIPATPIEDGATPNGSGKKRKRINSVAESLDGRPELKRPPTVLKLFTKNNSITTKSMAPTPGIKLKTKGKIPRRPQGVGYDSELEDREMDPVLLEGLVIRMQPGEDCDYIRDSIANGTVGVSILQKGADIRLRFLDVNGRRGILNVRGRQYAFTVVDLPTITEGMKSWDKKNFIKSIDISQLLLVLGRCSSDEDARNFPLPADVNPKNYKYAHGLTAPMRNVRKRRFERTARARLDDIEAIERKVAQILEADDRSSEVKWEVLDHDPRQEEDEYSDSDSDAEGEEDDEGYFPNQDGYVPEPAEHTAEDLSALEAMLEEQMEDMLDSGATTTQPATDVNSSAPSPMPMEDAPTPADADADADDDGDDDDDDENAEASDQEASDEKEEVLAKIREAEEKIAQQKEQLRKTANSIIRKKIAKKIQLLESDVKMMKRHAGIRDDDADGEGEDGGQENGNANIGAPRQEDSGSEEE